MRLDMTKRGWPPHPVPIVLWVMAALGACHRTMHTGSGSRDGQAGPSNADATDGATGASDGSVIDSASDAKVDTFVAGPTWISPFVGSVGAPGWKGSVQPLCDPHHGMVTALDVWADARGVFALSAVGCNDLAGVACGKQGVSIQLNTGSGWQLFGDHLGEDSRLWSGFPNGSLLVSGSFEKLGIAFVDASAVVFQREANSPSGAFVVNPALAYVLNDAAIDKYADGAWSTLGMADSPLSALWADDQVVVAVGYDQTMVVREGAGALQRVPSVPAGDYGAVWGFGRNDFWLGNSAKQLLHYDGSKWQVFATGSRNGSGQGITQLWGVAGTLFVATSTEFGRWNGASVDWLLSYPEDTQVGAEPTSFGRFWGRSPQEIFLPLRDRRYRYQSCGEGIVLFFDGSQFHQF
jgi:hypothetical protein